MPNDNLSEKVSVNINTSTLSNIDLLVDNGYYSNRSDFINQSLRESLQKNQNITDRIIETNINKAKANADKWFVGVFSLSKKDVENAKKNNQKINISGYGVLVIDNDIEEKILFEIVESIHLRGKSICKISIKEHYNMK